ncbi:ribonuclease T2 [Sistotremastrum niveocremeum HHB9708]|uniref:ribonuclease T2 n=1 Tax=Sistotremastrum niveocremeum HHB9708 TaxID=1314777 RepID=A0A165AHK5_9AGAM|nr:ribonuclease T2 [Sistotremastrum niveocremeum HHB9708]
MISATSFVGLAAVLAQFVAGTIPSFPGAPTFPDDLQCLFEKPVLSCENTTTIKDTCCSPTPGGLVLQTQFWDTYTGLEDQGQLLPDNSTWGIHGLWPDFCDGSFTQYCDISRQYDPHPSPNVSNGINIPSYTGPTVDTFIKAFGRYDLLEYMNTFWINQGDTNAHFWAHEFSKHATCFSTFDTKCYEPYIEHEDVINFFDTVIAAYKTFPTGKFLASAGIVPSNSTTYSLAAMQNAVKAHTGAIPYFGCTGPEAPNKDGRTIVDEVWHFNHVIGSPQQLNFKHIDSVTTSSCSPTGPIRYLERTPSSVRRK